MEVYNEKIFDLLTGARGSSLDVRQDTAGGTYVEGLSEELVTSPAVCPVVLFAVSWASRSAALAHPLPLFGSRVDSSLSIC